MFGNWWHKKERPLLGLTGLMGGNSSGLISGAKEGKFTVNGGSERPAKDGYESPVTVVGGQHISICLLYTSPSPRDATLSRMPSSA